MPKLFSLIFYGRMGEPLNVACAILRFSGCGMDARIFIDGGMVLYPSSEGII
jgi:hypothetical protein